MFRPVLRIGSYACAHSTKGVPMALTARDIMTPDPVTVTPETSIAAASKLMLERRFNGLPVVDEAGELKGILCQSDLVMQHKDIPVPSYFFLLDGYIPMQWPGKHEEEVQRMLAVTVGEAMTNNPRAVTPDTPVTELASLMVNKNFHTLPVVDKGKLVGVVGKEDMLRTIAHGQS